MKNNNDLSKFEEIMINIITAIVMLIVLIVIGAVSWFFVYGLWQLLM
ncbi:hypothetical protein QI349_02755 [Staphylococcus saprophyticus]|nr:hypothetical protein [Staphylococcus saprophyticus]